MFVHEYNDKLFITHEEADWLPLFSFRRMTSNFHFFKFSGQSNFQTCQIFRRIMREANFHHYQILYGSCKPATKATKTSYDYANQLRPKFEIF